MKDVVADQSLVAYCGLYCGACGRYLKGDCPGCHENAKATWCKIKSCCGEHSYATCADCKEHPDPTGCKQYTSLMAKVMSLLMNSNRPAGVLKIRELGVEGFAAFMAEKKLQTLPRRKG